MGKAGRLVEETLAKADAKSEKELQRQIVNLLWLKGIEVNVSRMDKRKTDKVGWPDLTFAVCTNLSGWPLHTYACAWEVKLPGKHLASHQRLAGTCLVTSPNAWTHRVITSVDQALEELKAMGIE